MAKHSRFAKYTSAGLFAGLKSFKELETRISALPLEKERGDAFEVFAEAYLATQPICQVKEVWPQTSAPSVMLNSLGLPVSRDMGTDGLVELKDGRVASYQAKFYTGRPSLNWGILSTFFAISDRVSHTIIFTNSDSLASTIEQRQNFIAIRGVDLDRLTPVDFSIIEEWLKGQPVARVIPKPRPHQEKALNDLLPALESSDRATVIMACGTGKTLLSLWAAERLGVKNVLVLVPSLALIQQTLHGWLAATGWDNLAYLCVCSDPTITDGADELVVKKSDLDFEVTTSPADVKRFLETEFNGVKVVFSTYMSANVVGQALNGRNIFDLGIFDEAHKTAGREGKAYAFALSDDNLPLKKRVFMTATPRHYNVLKRDKEGDAKLVYSMDVPESYGSVVHKLPFAEAARAGIICRYKVVISVVTSEMVGQELLKRGKVLVKGDEIHAQQVANQLALAAAVEKHGVGKIITFHKNIKSAQSFTAAGAEGITNHLKGFSVFHVNGSMPSAEREKLMCEFKNSKHGLISNAKCLTEGVDVPAVDMVAFLSPKRSTVDIVQATGRAMRKAPGKEVGYILVPLYLETKKGETIEDAVQRGKFEEVWDVLAALQEQDEVLADIIRQMREDCGRTKGYSDTRLKEIVEVLGPSVSLDALRTSITTACIDKLGVTWDERYGELIAYKKQYGDCRVPQRWTVNPQLAGWVANQRSRQEKLSRERLELLQQIGFVWDPLDSSWEEGFAALYDYRKKHGDCNVPQHWETNPVLAKWVSVQRVFRKKRLLSDNRIKRLNEIGFDWDPYNTQWEKSFADFQGFVKKYGHQRVSRGGKANLVLAHWVLEQRGCYSSGKMLPEREKRLNDIGFVWAPKESAWEAGFIRLSDYRAKHGDSNVSQSYGDKKLAKWVNQQRVRYSNGELEKERVERLVSLGFVWNVIDSVWEKNFEALIVYKRHHGNCSVPQGWASNPELGIWVGTQRSRNKSGTISESQKSRLNVLGFVWDTLASEWDTQFLALKDYSEKHGDCNVPQSSKEYPILGRWVTTQRRCHEKGMLNAERLERLLSIGFNLDPRAANWEKWFNELVKFKQANGHCNVPAIYPANSLLGRWVAKQRRRKVKKQISQEQEKILNSLGFEWRMTMLRRSK